MQGRNRLRPTLQVSHRADVPSLEFIDDPATFLAAAEEHLAADPVLTTVIASVTRRIASADAAGHPRGDHPRWWLLVRDDGGAVVGAAMRTAPFAPHPFYVLPDARRVRARPGAHPARAR